MRRLGKLIPLVLLAALLAGQTAAAAELPGQGVTLNVNVYRNPGGNEVAFGFDLDTAGLLALKFSVVNESAQNIIVRRSDMTLKLHSGQQIGAISAKQAALRADSGPNVAGVMAGAFFFGYTGAAIAYSAEQSARRNQVSSYDTKEFKDIALAPEESAGGYVFFHLASGVVNAQGGELLVRLIDSASGAVSVAAVPLVDVGGEAVATPEPESRLLKEAGRDVVNNQTNQAPEPQIEVIGALSTVTVPAPDPAAQPAAAAPAPANVTPMTGTALSAPPPAPPGEAEEEKDELEGSTEPLGGPAGRP